MLPPPSLARRQYAGAYAPYSLSGGVMGVLRQRARLTNLAVALLLAILGVSLLANLSHALHSAPQDAFAIPVPVDVDAWDDVASSAQLLSHRPPSVETTIRRDKRMANVDHLVLVPGHAVWVGEGPSRVREDEGWVLEKMQRGGSVKTYVKHIEKGAEILLSDPRSLLVFSG
jgi:hypothetical protein